MERIGMRMTLLACGLAFSAGWVRAEGQNRRGVRQSTIRPTRNLNFLSVSSNRVFWDSPGMVNPWIPFNPWTPEALQGAAEVMKGTGEVLKGAAEVMQAYGTVIISNEEARIMREQANQARIDTAKKRFEYELWLKANTPSFTDEQAKIAKTVLKRVQATNNPNEISSGKSLNILLDDLRRTMGTNVPSSEAIPLGEDVLRHVNVTGLRSSSRNLGLLRNDGRFTWPPALQQLLPQNVREEIEVQAQAVVEMASNGKRPGSLLIDLQKSVDKTRDHLVAKINDVPTSQFIEAKRFLDDFDDARRALQAGDAVRYFEFQKWVSGGKSIQEVVEYLSGKGLSFAPAVLGDESAYQALHSALAAYDIAYNAQFASAAPSKE